MAKKKIKPTSPATSDLAFSLFHTRFEQLEQDHQWLLKQIKRKRTELTNFLEQMQAIALEIVQRSQPFHEKLIELDREIHSLFEEIFTTRKFGKQSRQKIEKIYQMLQMTGAISPKGNRDREDKDGSKEGFSQADTENDADFNSDRDDREDNIPPNHENSNANPELKQMRRSFLRLAAIFHPDKVTDGENKEDYAEIMKEINRAYEEGDMARLLELERQYELDKAINLDDASNSEIERKCDRLEMENKMLKTQYENIKLELRWMRRTPEGEMVKAYRSLVREGFDPIQEMIGDAQNHIQEVEELYQFVADFRDKKITIKDFLKGPNFGKPIAIEEEMQEIMEDLFSQLERIHFEDF